MFQAPRVGDNSHSTRFDMNTTLIFLMAVSFDIIAKLFRHCLVEFKVPVFLHIQICARIRRQRLPYFLRTPFALADSKPCDVELVPRVSRLASHPPTDALSLCMNVALSRTLALKEQEHPHRCWPLRCVRARVVVPRAACTASDEQLQTSENGSATLKELRVGGLRVRSPRMRSATAPQSSSSAEGSGSSFAGPRSAELCDVEGVDDNPGCSASLRWGPGYYSRPPLSHRGRKLCSVVGTASEPAGFTQASFLHAPVFSFVWATEQI